MKQGLEARTPRPTLFSTRLAAALGAAAALALGCTDPGVAPRSPTSLQRSLNVASEGALMSPVMNVLITATDAAGKPLTDATDKETLVFGPSRTSVTAPDGHQLTYGEYSTTTGQVSLSCGENGTTVMARLHGLVPNGFYTFWLLSFKSPGFDPTFANLIGKGSVGPNDGSENSFTASAGGAAEFTTVIPVGSLSNFGSVACLMHEFEVHLVGAYHYPYPVAPRASWPDPGPRDKFIEHFGAVFQP